jgi:molybdopterin synthase sulfur carrier subunit
MIKVLFFAKLSEQLGVRELQIDAKSAEDTKQLFTYLLNHKAEWADILTSQPCLKAVNQTMVANDVALKDGDEVAYFPPVTGG